MPKYHASTDPGMSEREEFIMPKAYSTKPISDGIHEQISMEDELKNADLCDYVINTGHEDVVSRILDICHIQD